MDKVRNYALCVASIVLLIAAGSNNLLFDAAHGATSRSAISLKSIEPGIRLATPVEVLCGNRCVSQQEGCEDLSVCVSMRGCQLPIISSAIVSGGTAPYSFNVTDPDGIAVTVSSQIENPPGTFSVTFTATKLGSYKVKITDARGCRATCRAAPSLAVGVSPVNSLCISALLKATVSGGTPPYTFNVSDPNGGLVPVLPAGSDDFGTSVFFTANKAGFYSVKVTDAAGCFGEGGGGGIPCQALTQSEWGNNKPKFNGQKRVKTIQRIFRDLLSHKALVVGVVGERSITFTQDGASCVMQRLPASGPPASLPAGLGDAQINSDTCQTPVVIPLLNDKFQNALLGQIIALTLNAGGVFDDGGLTFDTGGIPTLWHLGLCENMVTRGVLSGSDGLFGTNDDVVDTGDPGSIVVIPTSVLSAIAAGSTLELLGKFTVLIGTFPVTVPAGTVGRLIMLANIALAGEANLGGATVAEINSAVDATNRAFDRCRFFVGCAITSQSSLQLKPDTVDDQTGALSMRK
jgi:hypothetical protein